MNFEEYIDENIEHVAKIREKLKARFGAIDRDLELLLARAAVEPWGIVKRENANHDGRAEGRNPADSGKAAATDSGIAEIMAKRHLVDDNGKLKLSEFLEPHDFTILAKELQQHGYKYSKKAGGFLLEGKGVKQ